MSSDAILKQPIFFLVRFQRLHCFRAMLSRTVPRRLLESFITGSSLTTIRPNERSRRLRTVSGQSQRRKPVPAVRTSGKPQRYDATVVCGDARVFPAERAAGRRSVRVSRPFSLRTVYLLHTTSSAISSSTTVRETKNLTVYFVNTLNSACLKKQKIRTGKQIFCRETERENA